MKITRTADKVLFHTIDGIIAMSQECNVFPHPTLQDFITIAENGSKQDTNGSYSFKWSNNTDYSDTAFIAQNRNELIEILAKYYFNTGYKIDATRFFDTNGDGSGTKDFSGDYSGTATKAIIKAEGRALRINRLIAFIADSSSVDAGKYGNGITLINGIEIKKEKQTGEIIKDITDGISIKTNADYAKLGFQVSDISFGSGLNYVHAVLTFNKNGTGINLQPDEQLSIYLNDNLTGLQAHTFRAGAYYLE